MHFHVSFQCDANLCFFIPTRYLAVTWVTAFEIPLEDWFTGSTFRQIPIGVAGNDLGHTPRLFVLLWIAWGVQHDLLLEHLNPMATLFWIETTYG